MKIIDVVRADRERLLVQRARIDEQLLALAEIERLAEGLEAGEAPDPSGETPSSSPPPRGSGAASNGGGPGASPAPKLAKRPKPKPAPNRRAGSPAAKKPTLADRIIAACAARNDATIHTIQHDLAGHGTPGSIKATLGQLVTAGRITKHGTRGRQTYRPGSPPDSPRTGAPEPAPAGTDFDFVRRERRELVLHTLREQGPMTRGRLKRATELGHGEIVQILADLDRAGLARRDPRTTQWAACETATEAA